MFDTNDDEIETELAPIGTDIEDDLIRIKRTFKSSFSDFDGDPEAALKAIMNTIQEEGIDSDTAVVAAWFYILGQA